MSDSDNGRDECRHGSLRRACETCQRDDDNAALYAALERATAELKSRREYLPFDMRCDELIANCEAALNQARGGGE